MSTVLGWIARIASFLYGAWNFIPKESQDKILNKVVDTFTAALSDYYDEIKQKREEEKLRKEFDKTEVIASE